MTVQPARQHRRAAVSLLVRVAAVAVFSAGSTGLGRAEIVTLTAARDATLFASDTGSVASGSGPAVFIGANSASNVRRGLVYFDVHAAVPPETVLDAVELRLFVSNAPDETPRTITVHRVESSWSEGTSVSVGGAGAAAQSGDATWLHTAYPSAFWSSPGGDFAAQSSAAAMVGPSGWHAWAGPQLLADVRAWLAGTSPNHGWLLLGQEDTPSSARRVDSRESQTPPRPPELRLRCEPCSVAIHSNSTWGRIKSLYRNAPR